MKFSIITATYNRADTIRDTIESILAQTYEDWEHIIVDGASKDNSLEIISDYQDKYNGRLKLISEKDKGIYDAMNKGIALATGDYIGFLNSDDFFFDSHVLEKVANALTQQSTDCIFGGTVVVDPIDTDKVVWVSKGSPYPPKGFSSGWHPSHPTFYTKKSCYDSFGSFDLDFGTASDLEIMLRFIEGRHISTQYLPIFFNKMRFGGASNKSFEAILNSNNQVLKAFDKNGLKRPKFYLWKKMWPKVMNRIKHVLGINQNINFQ